MPSRPSHPATIDDVARAAGVSRAAVSKVIRDAYGVSDDMRAKVSAAIAELGYRPRAAARAMRGSSYTLGVEIPDVQNQFFPKIIDGASRALAGTAYQLIIAPAGPDHDYGPQAIEVLADRQVDGIVAISSRVAPTWLEELARRVPLVMIGRHDESVNYDTLVGDDVTGARQAVQHLVDLGHRRIVHLTLEELEPTPHARREAAYRQLMAELRLTPEVTHVGSSRDSARAAAAAVLADANGPVGFFAGHDELAFGVLQAIGELGLSPAQASVVGYDDTDMAEHALVSLTSVNQSGTLMGATAARLLLERLEGRTEPVHAVMPTKVMIRRSSAAPASASREPAA